MTVIIGFLGGLSMSLTERRRQFLQQLVGLYQKTTCPVHYITLAKALGVSKWTAYDMLRELEKLGYLSRDYIHDHGGAGRSQIVFVPTDKAVQLISLVYENRLVPAEWSEMERNMIGLLQELRHAEMGFAVSRLIETVSHTPNGITFCLSLLGLLTLFLSHAEEPVRTTVEQVILSLDQPRMRIIVFIGTMLGIVIQTVSDELGRETSRLIGRALCCVQELSESELIQLANFLSKALQQVQ